MPTPISAGAQLPHTLRSLDNEIPVTGGISSVDHNPQQLYSSRVNKMSLSWLKNYITSGDESQKNVATVALKAIEQNALTLGSAKAQTQDKFQYGAQIMDNEGRTCTLLVNLCPDHRNDFDLTSVAIRYLGSNNIVSLRPKQDSAAAATQGLPGKGESSSTAPSNATPNLVSKANSKLVTQLVKTLSPWDQKRSLQTIELKLNKEPSHEHQVLIQSLTKVLLSTSSAEKPACIEKWAATETREHAIQDRDLRTPSERELQEKVMQQLKDPKFSDAYDAISSLLTIKERKIMRSIGVQAERYNSPLLNRVFSGKLPPAEAIQKIKSHIVNLEPHARHQAILDWSNE